MSLNSPRGAAALPPKPSPREIAQARDWLDDVLPDGAKQEAKDLTKSTKTASTLALERAGFATKQAETPVAAEPEEVEHAHPSPRVAEPEESLELERKPSFFQRTASRLRRGSMTMSFSKKKDKKGGAAKDGRRRDEDDEFYMGASGQVVLGHARSFYNRKTPQKQKQPKPPARTASGVRRDGGSSSGSPGPDGNKSWRDSLSEWLADVLPDGSRKSDRKSGWSGSPSERSKPKQPQLTASTAGWKSAGFVTQNGGQKAGAASSSEGRGEISIGLDDSDRSLWSERSARSRRGSQDDAPPGTS